MRLDSVSIAGKLSVAFLLLALAYLVGASSYLAGLEGLPTADREAVSCSEYFLDFSSERYSEKGRDLGRIAASFFVFVVFPLLLVCGLLLARRWLFFTVAAIAVVVVLLFIGVFINAIGCALALADSCFVSDGECVEWIMWSFYALLLLCSFTMAVSDRVRRMT